MTNDSWRLITSELTDPFLNMSLEEAVARSVGEGESKNTLRFWRNFNTVVIGCFQSVDSEINPEAYRSFKVKLVRRFTGGGAVYQDEGNLNFSLAVKTPHEMITNNIHTTFKNMSEWVVKGLKKLGATTTYDKRNSILINGRKISGLSGSKRWGSFFIHGTLLVTTDISFLEKILRPRHEIDFNSINATRSRNYKVTNLSTELEKTVGINMIKEVLRESFEASYGVTLNLEEFNDRERRLASKLCREKYSRLEWNFKK